MPEEVTPITIGIYAEVKSFLAIPAAETGYDSELVTGINSAFSSLSQFGANPDSFSVESREEDWSDFLSDDPTLLGFIKEYVNLRTKLFFDPPSGQVFADSIQRRISELEFRIVNHVETVNYTLVGEEEEEI